MEKIRLAVNGYDVIGQRVVDNQAIVIPETIDAIRALTGIENSAENSIKKTNRSLGIDTYKNV
jgi:glyceraldehyde-3-phosphate dehydrogenase (NAD(P))